MKINKIDLLVLIFTFPIFINEKRRFITNIEHSIRRFDRFKNLQLNLHFNIFIFINVSQNLNNNIY